MANILIMEDDDLQSALYATGLESVGHTVTVAASASEAMAHLSDQIFDLLVTDIIVNQNGRSVPDGGVLLIGRLRGAAESTAMRANAKIPIIAMSGAVSNTGMENILTVAQGIGANVVLTKPFMPDDMHEQVTALLANNPNT